MKENNNFCDYFSYRKTIAKNPILPGMKEVDDSYVKPRTSYYHYSNPNSQGAIICEVGNFDYYNPETESITSAYSDRLISWDSAHYEKVVKEFEISGDQAWAYNLPKLNNKDLIKFAKEMLKLPVLPRAVRVLHWYNVSNGYSSPSIEAIYKSKKKD